MRRSVFSGILLLSSATLAADPVLGDGHWGELNARSAETQVNRYAALVADAGTGFGAVNVGAAGPGFLAGDLVMLYQATDSLPFDSGTPGPFDVDGSGAGRWELARVSGVDGGVLLLAEPLAGGYNARHTQVILVPEYTEVTITAGSAVVAEPWNGREGGVVAFLATGTVLNEGTISATGAGFRGGVRTQGSCSGSNTLDGAGPPHGRKGEGVLADRFGPGFAARGNVANGAGGGNVCNAGGGGGGNGGQGGKGGFAAQSLNDNGGFGGTALIYSGAERLLFGGGGGAGDGNHNQAGEGGNGGGVVFLRALELRGEGTIAADGEKGQDAGTSMPSDGAGGGGAGGTVSLRVAGEVECGTLQAMGADGGNSPEFQATGGPCGPGGGGGGGRVLVQAGQLVGCPVLVRSGTAGVQPDPLWPVFYGATPDGGGFSPYVGVSEVLSPGLDAGFSEDAGTDAGTDEDAGVDAGVEVDAGADAGVIDSPDAAACVPTRLDVGCGCTSPGTSSLALGLAVVVVVLSRRRRI